MSSEKKVLVTGFGPFGDHKTNASWEAVKELWEMRDDLRDRRNIKLIVDQIPVVYDHVTKRVPQLWEDHDPQIVLHVGVSNSATCLTIEYMARGHSFTRPDIEGKCPRDECDKRSEALRTKMNVESLCRKMNDNGTCKALISDNAGHYLCEYIYYQSLCKSRERTLFIHVPNFHVYTSKVTAQGLREIIEILAEDMENFQ